MSTGSMPSQLTVEGDPPAVDGGQRARQGRDAGTGRRATVSGSTLPRETVTTGSTGAPRGTSGRSPPAKSTTNLRRLRSGGWPMMPPRPIRVAMHWASGGRAGRVGAPVQPVARARAPGPVPAARAGPEGHDVVEGLVGGRQLDQVEAALAPVAQRLDPERGPRARSGHPRPGSVSNLRSRWRRPKPRGFSSLNQETRRLGGLTSGRQTHSPLPRHIASPSESWISCAPFVGHRGGRSRRTGTCWSAARCRAARTCRRMNSWAVTSMIVTPPEPRRSGRRRSHSRSPGARRR